MLVDITFKITPEIAAKDPSTTQPALSGHLGTHFDVMDKEFPLEYTERDGIIFDVSGVKDRDIGVDDVNVDLVNPGTFVAFYSGYTDRVEYGSDGYFANSPQLSNELIECLLNKNISIIGLDFAGIRRGKEHIPKDQLCAEHGTFVVENLCNLGLLVEQGKDFSVNTYPMNFSGMTGLPCRVIAKIK